MMKLRKGLSLKIVILFIVAIFLLNSTCYGIDCNNTHLRNRLVTDDGNRDIERLQLVSIEIGKQLYAEIEIEERKLQKIFVEILSPLKDGDITVERVRTLFSENQKHRIFEVIKCIREKTLQIAVVEGSPLASKKYARIRQNDAVDTGLCNVITPCFKKAALELDLSPIVVDIVLAFDNIYILLDDSIGKEYAINLFSRQMTTEIERINRIRKEGTKAHTLCALEGKDKYLITIDAASGQYIQANRENVAVDLGINYLPRIAEIIHRFFSSSYEGLMLRDTRRYWEKEFGKNREAMLMEILKSRREAKDL